MDYKGFSNVPRPVFDRGVVYLCTGYMKPEVWAIRADGEGDVTQDHVLWREAKQAPANVSPLLIDDILYTVSDMGVITARATATGRELWSQRLGGPASASPVYAEGRIYVCDENGKTSVLKPGAKFDLLERNAVKGRVQASPALAGQAIYLRTDTHLYRIENSGH